MQLVIINFFFLMQKRNKGGKNKELAGELANLVNKL